MEVARVLILFTLSVIVICCDGASLKTKEDVPLTFDAEGGYHFSYSLDDHSRNETGVLKRIGDAAVYVVIGSYSYTGDDGEVNVVNYIADENGFRIQPKIEVGDRVYTNPKTRESLVGPG